MTCRCYPPSRESAASKAARLLTSGRVLISRVDDARIEALVRGDTGLYRVGGDPEGWSCTCPNPGRACSHIRAVRLVALVPAEAVAELRSLVA